MMLMLAVTASYAAAPVELKEYKGSTYDCAYFDWWYFGYSESSYFGYVIFDANGKEIAFTVMSQSETDYVTYIDGVQFKDEYEDRDVESHYYMSTYWVLNSLNGVRWGNDAVVANSVLEVKDSEGTTVMALRDGNYYFRVMEVNYTYDDNGTITGVNIGGYQQIPFTISSTKVAELKAEVAKDKKTASITWTDPALPFGTHLYVSVQSGSDVAYDNIAKKVSPTQPLVVNVKENRTYSVSAQYVNAKNEPQGSAVKIYFTVGTNKYIPSNVKATVADGNKVKFSWSATEKADYYRIIVYKNGVTYAEYTTQEQSLSKNIATGSYSWEIAAYEKDDNELYYPITEFIKGNDFSTEAPALPEGTTELSIWGMEAFYFESEASAGKYPWVVKLESGTNGGNGLPEPWITIYSTRERAISGSYSSALGNVAISSTQGEDSFLNTNDQASGLVQATSVTLYLELDGFDQEYINYGYYIPYYSGEFYMTCSDGKQYYGRINQLMCGTYPGTQITTSPSSRDVLSMFEEDPAWQGFESIQTSDDSHQKIVRDGQVIIIRDGKEYNVLGTRL